MNNQMGAASITLPHRLSEKLSEKAEEMGYLPEELGVELLDARELLKKGDLVQASEKFWGTTALTIKMVAAKRGLKLEEHGSLWAFVNALSKKSGDKDLIGFFNTANALHRNFYENEMPTEAVGVSAEDIEKLIEKLRRIL
ncbi:MAG: PaREP1 family protein [Halobacteriota archaeon]